jgi:hypothetical protein
MTHGSLDLHQIGLLLERTRNLVPLKQIVDRDTHHASRRLGHDSVRDAPDFFEAIFALADHAIGARR